MTIQDFLSQTPPYPAGGRTVNVRRFDHGGGSKTYTVELHVGVDGPLGKAGEDASGGAGDTIDEASSKAFERLSERM